MCQSRKPGLSIQSTILTQKATSAFRVCAPGSLDATKVKDSIVICVPGNTFGLYYPEEEVHAKGGIATIIIDDDLKAYAQVFKVPSVTTVSVGVGDQIQAYVNSTR